MSSIIRDGSAFHGISVAGRGVFTSDKYGMTYAGQYRDGYACGLGVFTGFGSKEYAEYGLDGKHDGRSMHHEDNLQTEYALYERGRRISHSLATVCTVAAACTATGPARRTIRASLR